MTSTRWMRNTSFAICECNYQVTSVVDAENCLLKSKQAAKEVSRYIHICLHFLWRLDYLRQGNLMKTFSSLVERTVLKARHKVSRSQWKYISLGSDLFCNYLNSSALIGVTLILAARAGEIWCNQGELCSDSLMQDHRMHQLALLDNSSPANYLTLLQYASLKIIPWVFWFVKYTSWIVLCEQ